MGVDFGRMNPYSSPMCEGTRIPFAEIKMGDLVELVGLCFPGYYSFVASRYITINLEMEQGERIVGRIEGYVAMFLLLQNFF